MITRGRINYIDTGGDAVTVACFYGLSTDSKPTEEVPNGAAFVEMDTSRMYLFDAENTEWILWHPWNPDDEPTQATLVYNASPVGNTLGGLSDVTLLNLQSGQTLKYDEIAAEWVNGWPGTTEIVSGTTPTIAGVADHRYICGEVSSISITPPSDGIIDVIFTSGSSVAVLTLPNTVKVPDWFVVQTNHIYEINILNGEFAAVMSWTLS